MIQCTKMTNSLTNLCDFRGLSFPFLPAVTMLYAALMRHVMNCFDRFGQGPLNIGREVGGGWRQKCSDTNFWGPAKMSGPEPTSR